jgi:hypothetical protein
VQCKGNGLCPHLKQRSKCKVCGGSSICVHNNQKHYCADCGGSSICPHKRRKKLCRECQFGSQAGTDQSSTSAAEPESKSHLSNLEV